MKLISLQMMNWRPFKGTQLIEFASEPDKPLTLLLGPNGAGKTALLNTFTWCLYGDFTDGFDDRELLVNRDAVAAEGESAQTWVAIEFEHDGDEYRVRRATDAVRQTAGEYDVTVTKNGNRTVEDDVRRILPAPLKDLFFFPAETFSTASVLRSDELTEAGGNSLDVGRAIRTLLSGDIYDHASKDLREAIDTDILKQPKNYRDETVERARRHWEQAKAELDDAEERRDTLPGLLAEARQEAAKAKARAERFNPEEIDRWQQRHTELTEAVQEAQSSLRECNDLYVELARMAQFHFAACATAGAIRRLDLAEDAGLMPPRIHEEVLDATLEKGRCSLCGEPLAPQAKERIHTLRGRVGEAELAVQGMEVRSMLKARQSQHRTQLDNARTRVRKTATAMEMDDIAGDADVRILAATVRQCIDYASRLLDQAIDERDRFIDDVPVDMPDSGRTPVDLYTIKQRRVDELQRESERITAEIERLRQAERESFNDFQKKSRKSKEYERKTTAIEILKEAKGYFDAARRGLERYGRQDFQQAINDTYQDLIGKPFDIDVADDFSLTVRVEETGEKATPSQSEKVLLLIAFLGAIARLAPDYEEIARRGEQFKQTGGVRTSARRGFPVVLDAPTSPLDEEYEVDVVKALPGLLPQVIVPVSAKSVSTWETIHDYVGAAYVMELRSKSASDRTVRWGGKDHVYSATDPDTIARTRLNRIN